MLMLQDYDTPPPHEPPQQPAVPLDQPPPAALSVIDDCMFLTVIYTMQGPHGVLV